MIPIKKISSHWKQMPTWEDFGVSIAIIMMFKDLKEKLGILPEQMGNFGQETVTKKNQMEVLELNSTMAEMRNVLHGIKSQLDYAC